MAAEALTDAVTRRPARSSSGLGRGSTPSQLVGQDDVDDRANPGHDEEEDEENEGAPMRPTGRKGGRACLDSFSPALQDLTPTPNGYVNTASIKPKTSCRNTGNVPRRLNVAGSIKGNTT